MPIDDSTVVLHVAGIVNEYTKDAVSAEAGKLVDPGRGSRASSSQGGDRMTVHLWPVSDPAAYARKTKFGEVRSVVGRVITLVAHKVEGPPPDADSVTKALFNLAWNHGGDRPARGLEELKKIPPNDRRAEVAKALETCLAGEADLWRRALAVEVLGFWGSKDNLPALVRASQDKEGPVRQNAVRALARFPDETALEALGACLATERFAAKDALKAAGPAAEKVLLKYLESPTDHVRQDVCELLESSGSKACVPAMIRALKEESLRRSVLKVLTRLKASAADAAEPVARMLGDFFIRREVVEALKAFGPGAEKAVLGQLAHTDAGVRQEACRILKEIGTAKSLQSLALLAQQDPGSRDAAVEAIQAIQARR
jgi:HEAT repeat protein